MEKIDQYLERILGRDCHSGGHGPHYMARNQNRCWCFCLEETWSDCRVKPFYGLFSRGFILGWYGLLTIRFALVQQQFMQQPRRLSTIRRKLPCSL